MRPDRLHRALRDVGERLRLDATLAGNVGDLHAVPVGLRGDRAERAHLVALEADEPEALGRREGLERLERRQRVAQRLELGNPYDPFPDGILTVTLTEQLGELVRPACGISCTVCVADSVCVPTASETV